MDMYGLTREECIEVAKAWLRSKRTTLWQQWILTSESGLQDAAEFLVDTVWAFVPELYKASIEK